MASNGGYVQIRNGLREHVAAGQFSPTDLAVYLFLHLHKNWKTAICWTNARSIATCFKLDHASTVQDSFRRLRDKGYIQYRPGDGKRGSYPVLIVGDEPTHGVLKGCRLIGFAESTYEAVNYQWPPEKPTDAVLRACADRVETGRWACADRALTVPLPDITDFKTDKTLPDLSNLPEPSAGVAQRSDQGKTLCPTCHDQSLFPGQTMCSKCEEANA